MGLSQCCREHQCHYLLPLKYPHNTQYLLLILQVLFFADLSRTNYTYAINTIENKINWALLKYFNQLSNCDNYLYLHHPETSVVEKIRNWTNYYGILYLITI